MAENREALSPLWESAIAEYEADTKRTPISALDTLRAITTPEELLAQIETSGQAFKDFRSRRAKLWNTLKTFVSPLSVVLKVAITPASVGDSFGIPASAVLGACLYLVKACENVSDAYDWIEQVFTELQEFSERLSIYTESRIDDVLKKKMVAILAFTLRVIGRSERLIKENRFGKYLRVTFLGKDEKTKKLVEDLNKLFGSEQRFVLAVTFATTQRIEDRVARIEEGVSKVNIMMHDAQERETAAQQAERVQHTLCNTSALQDVQESYFRNKRDLVKGTSAWLQDEPIFRSWIEHSATILWIFGGPGAGKSYLSTWIVRQLLEDLPEEQRKDMSVAYFFVKENNQVLRDANNILKTLAWQLMGQDLEYKKHVAAVCAQRLLTITAEDTWENLFLSYYGRRDTNPRFASIVIDGLDEATPLARRTLLGFMKGLVSASHSPQRPAIQFAVVGRTSLKDDMEFTRQEKVYLIEVSKFKNRQDIDRYIRNRVRDFAVVKVMKKTQPQLAKKTRTDIKNKVLDAADGVFLWAKLLLDVMARKDLTQIESILKDPPGDLDDMIWSVFDRLARDEEIDHGMLRKMLLFMTHAQRPLKFGELDLFLSLPNRKPNFLLWKQTRGKLSSVFDLKFPKGYVPDEENEIDDQENNADRDSSSDPSDEDDNDDDTDDALGSTADENQSSVDDNGLQPKRWGLQRETTDEIINHLSDGQLKTEVTFCHVRIRNYLVDEAHPRTRRKPACSVIPELDSVHAEITISCLDVLHLEISLRDDSRYLADYPMRYLALHLEEVDRQRTSDEDFWRIVSGLYWLFGTERGVECLVKANQDYDEFHSSHEPFIQMWIATDRYLRLLQQWYSDVEQRGGGQGYGVDPEARAWMKNAALSFKSLLRPAMIAASKMWLSKTSFQGREYLDTKGEYFCWLLHGWMFLAEHDFADTKMKYYSWDNFGMLSAERLEHMASWAGLEHDTHWHTCLGWILMDGCFYSEAISHYKEAITLCAGAWVALEGLARSYGEQGEYKLAIDCQTKAIEKSPKEFSWLPSFLFPWIADWSLKLDNEELAYEAACNGFKASGGLHMAQLKYLEALDRRGESQKIMDTIDELHNVFSIGEDLSWLHNLFMCGYDVFQEIGRACRELGQPKWVLEVMDESLEGLNIRELPVRKLSLSLNITQFRYDWYDYPEEEFIKFGENFLTMVGRQRPEYQAQLAEGRKSITNKLAQLYFDSAVGIWDDGKGANSASVFADKLKTLAVSVETNFGEDYDGFDFYRMDYPALLWGRWLRDYKKAEERVWRKCFKVRLLEEMNSLDDDDPANDETGMASLAVSLFHAGNRQDAAAVLAILFKGLEDMTAKEAKNFSLIKDGLQIKSEDGDIVNPQLKDTLQPLSPTASKTVGHGLTLHITQESWNFLCNNCNRLPSQVDEFYYCEICILTNWCGDCLKKLRDPTITPGLKKRECNPNHDAYRAWPIPDSARDMAAEYLDGGIELRKEWLESLREEWLRASV